MPIPSFTGRHLSRVHGIRAVPAYVRAYSTSNDTEACEMSARVSRNDRIKEGCMVERPTYPCHIYFDLAAIRYLAVCRCTMGMLTLPGEALDACMCCIPRLDREQRGIAWRHGPLTSIGANMRSSSARDRYRYIDTCPARCLAAHRGSNCSQSHASIMAAYVMAQCAR